jgi:regulator of replication initiation timing
MILSEDLQAQLQKVLEECASLREENERLKKLLGLFPEDRATTKKSTVSEPPSLYTATGPSVTNND